MPDATHRLTDDLGREWRLVVNSRALKRLKRDVGDNLRFATPCVVLSWLADTVSDPNRLVRVLFTLARPVSDGPRQTFGQFLTGFQSETLARSVPHLLRAFAGWSRSRKMAAGLAQLANRYEGNA